MIMSIELSEDYNKRVIEKAKKYAEKKGLETLLAKIDLFESVRKAAYDASVKIRSSRGILEEEVVWVEIY